MLAWNAGHEGKVTGLALMPDWTLASVSHDRTIRLWDLHTFKLLRTVRDAHETPLQVGSCTDNSLTRVNAHTHVVTFKMRVRVSKHF